VTFPKPQIHEFIRVAYHALSCTTLRQVATPSGAERAARARTPGGGVGVGGGGVGVGAGGRGGGAPPVPRLALTQLTQAAAAAGARAPFSSRDRSTTPRASTTQKRGKVTDIIYSGAGKLRIVTLGTGTGRQEKLVLLRGTNHKLSRRWRSPRSGLQSWRGKSAGVVAKR
jgi:hypothetical protein